jgi:hypothetical protein
LISKKIPGITIVFSFSNSSKNVCTRSSQTFMRGNKSHKAHETVVDRRGEFLEVEPNIECADGRDAALKAELLQALENVVALHLEVALERNLLGLDVLRVEERDRRKLQAEGM